MAMYTKMTATGSSLIVNPRTISKELETKIAASIASVMATHDVAKLSTKLVRQAVEKDVHVSLANHKEVLKRLMHQELRKIKAKKVGATIGPCRSMLVGSVRTERVRGLHLQAAKRVVPEPWKIAARRESIVKGAALRAAPALFSMTDSVLSDSFGARVRAVAPHGHDRAARDSGVVRSAGCRERTSAAPVSALRSPAWSALVTRGSSR